MTTQRKTTETRKMNRFIRIRDVMAICGRSRTRIYMDMKEGRFPKPVKIGPAAVAWYEPDIIAWQEEKLVARDAA